MFRKHIKGELSEQCLWTYFPHQIRSARLANVHDNEGTVLAPIQAAPEDLLVPKKFADAIPCSHKSLNHEESSRSRPSRISNPR